MLHGTSVRGEEAVAPEQQGRGWSAMNEGEETGMQRGKNGHKKHFEVQRRQGVTGGAAEV